MMRTRGDVAARAGNMMLGGQAVARPRARTRTCACGVVAARQAARQPAHGCRVQPLRCCTACCRQAAAASAMHRSAGRPACTTLSTAALRLAPARVARSQQQQGGWPAGQAAVLRGRCVMRGRCPSVAAAQRRQISSDGPVLLPLALHTRCTDPATKLWCRMMIMGTLECALGPILTKLNPQMRPGHTNEDGQRVSSPSTTLCCGPTIADAARPRPLNLLTPDTSVTAGVVDTLPPHPPPPHVAHKRHPLRTMLASSGMCAAGGCASTPTAAPPHAAAATASFLQGWRQWRSLLHCRSGAAERRSMVTHAQQSGHQSAGAVCLASASSPHNACISVVRMPDSEGLPPQLRGATILTLDASGNVHSVVRHANGRSGGSSLTGAYW